MIKRLSLLFFVIVTAFSFSSPKSVLATCTCTTVNNVKTLVKNNCASGKNPVMYIKTNAKDGCRCVCETIGSPANKLESTLCADGVSVNTAFGCVPVQLDKFITWLLPILFGIAGGISFLLMVYGFILMTTSNGDPKAVQGAKETVTSAIVGLLICIFAIFLLRLIAVDILKIPGMSY